MASKVTMVLMMLRHDWVEREREVGDIMGMLRMGWQQQSN